MSRRWLVTLALAVVALPEAAAAHGLRVAQSNRTVTTTKALPGRAGQPRVGRLPASIEVDAGAIIVTTRHRKVRHALGRTDGLSWLVTVGPRVVIGFAARAGGHADTIVAIDHVTGELAWRRSVDSLFAAELVGDLVAVERAGTLDVLDGRTGNTVGTAALAGQGIQAIGRSPIGRTIDGLGTGDLHLKTRGDLVAIDRHTGAVRWVQPSSSLGNAAVSSGAVVDAWVERQRHRFGVVSYDPVNGRRLDSIDLGSTGGWYDLERVELAPDGLHDVLVSALFAVG
jgi:outer membrane protein assembly factor BamB